MNDKKGKKPKIYKARFIEPGVISYEDTEEGGVIYIGREALDKMAPSFRGMPVINKVHKDTDPDEAFDFQNEESEKLADGIVTDVYYGNDGWYWVNFAVWDMETQNNIDNEGYSVSCAYKPTRAGPGGQHNKIDYDAEVLEGAYTHLAVVDPNYARYEKAMVFENAKKQKGDFMGFLNIIGIKPKEEKKEKKEDIQIEYENATYTLDNGEEVPLKKLVEVYNAEEKKDEKKEEKKDEKKPMFNMDEDYDIGNGEKVKGSALVAAYKKNMEKKEEKENECSDDKKNTEKEDEKKEEKKEDKQNASFDSLKNAVNKTAETTVEFTTKSDRLALGSERYGSAVKVEGGKNV
jgi:hypothetical protein